MPKITKALGPHSKPVGDPVTPKDIFYTLWKDGYTKNPLFGDPAYPKEQQYFVRCGNPKCKQKYGQVSGSDSTVAYTNPIDHAKRCWGIVYLEKLVNTARKHSGLSDSKRQAAIEVFMLNPTDEEKSLFHWMKLVCLHNEPISKITDRDFGSMLGCEKTSIKVFMATMFELSLIVEEKIAAEMKGAKGTIVHDSWSVFSRHYVCLLACYLIATGKRDANGDMCMETVMTLLTCTTLPGSVDDEEEADGDSELLRFLRVSSCVSFCN